MSKTPIASVVIPFYGEPADTLELIEQLKHQTIKDEIEIIVSDDCSPTPFPENSGVTVFRREQNGGFASNVNSGAKLATGKWLFILNSDLTLGPDFFEKAIAKAEELGDVLLSPQVLGHDGRGQWVGRKFPTTFHFAWEWFTPLARFRDTKFWHKMVGHDLGCETGVTKEVDWVMGACMIIQNETYRAVGGMDERFFMNSEEVDLQRRLRDLDVPRVFAGDLSVEHIGGASSGDVSRRRQWVLDSRFIYSSKWNENKHLAVALKFATYFNYIFNKLRELRNHEVRATATKDFELELIKNAERKS